MKNAVILTHNIDQPFVQQLESKNEDIKFMRIDSDVTEALKNKTSKKAQEELSKQGEELKPLFEKVLKKKDIKLVVEKLKNKKIASVITLSEEARRMQDMMKMYSMPGMDASMFGNTDGETIVLNGNHPLVTYILENKEKEDVNMFVEQLYDLAKLQHAPLSPEDMTRFVQRSNDILLKLEGKFNLAPHPIVRFSASVERAIRHDQNEIVRYANRLVNGLVELPLANGTVVQESFIPAILQGQLNQPRIIQTALTAITDKNVWLIHFHLTNRLDFEITRKKAHPQRVCLRQSFSSMRQSRA